MKKHLVTVLGTVILSASLMGCSSYGGPFTPAQVGTGVGAVGGGALGYAVTRGNPIGTAAGAVGGAVVGHAIGRSYEDRR